MVLRSATSPRRSSRSRGSAAGRREAAGPAGATIRGRVEVRRERPLGRGAPGGRRARRTTAPRDMPGPAAQRRLPRDGAPGRVRGARPRPRGPRPAQRERSSPTCSRSRWAPPWTSRTATAPTTTCSRSRRRGASTSAATRAGQSRSVRFDRPGVVRVFCEIHSHMSAFILVFAHRYFAITDAEGRYRIEGVPPGHVHARRLERRGGARATARCGSPRRAAPSERTSRWSDGATCSARCARASSRPPRSWRCCRSRWPSASRPAG